MKEPLALCWVAVMAFVAGHLEKPPTSPQLPPPRSVYTGPDFFIARVTSDTFVIMAQGPEDQAPRALSSGTAHLVSQNCIPSGTRIVPDELYRRSLLETIVSNPGECFPELSPFLTNN